MPGIAPGAGIVGVAESDLGLTPRSPLELIGQAVTTALDDCGLSLADVDGVATNGVAQFGAAQVAEYLGLQPSWTDTTFAGGASYEVFAGHAAEAIRAGLAKVVVIAYGSNQRSARSRRPGGRPDPQTPVADFEFDYGALNPLSLYALAAQRHMHEFGTTSEQLAAVAVAARAWALHNPKAFGYSRGPLAIEDVLASPMISSPLHKLDCCLVTDGGGAIVLARADIARSLRKPPVWVLGHAETTTQMTFGQIPDLTSTGAAESGRRAMTMAGLRASEIDVVQLYDSFTITVLLTLEALGFCPRGEAGPFVEGGRLGPQGDFPINTSGGGLSYCHPGMFGIFLLIEAARQLRGEAHGRQLERHETAICHGTGGSLSTHATVVLGLDDG